MTIDISESEHYRLLANERRRAVVDVLAERQSFVTLGELVAEVSVREMEGARGDEGQSAVQISLHHVHLPLMDDIGIIDYDRERNRVEPHTPSLERLQA